MKKKKEKINETEEDLLEVNVFWLPIVKEIFYQGKARVISSQNKIGRFDVLPRHTNFITLIFKDISVITPEAKKITYQFKRGVLEVTKNKVNVFLGI